MFAVDSKVVITRGEQAEDYKENDPMVFGLGRPAEAGGLLTGDAVVIYHVVEHPEPETGEQRNN